MIKKGKIDVDDFWERVDHLRDINEMTLVDLQTMIGQTGTYMSVARHHRSIPSIALLIRMADVLHCSVDYLVGHVSDTKDDPELDEVVDMWRYDPRFKNMVRPIVQALKNK